MRETKDNCITFATKQLTAEEIIKELTREAEMSYFLEGLHEMFLSFVRDRECPNVEFKNEIIHIYTCVRDLIKQIDQFKNQTV